MTPKVSIIVTSYNKSGLLPQALQSILNQSFEDWQCLIVDDNSTDGAWDVAQHFVALDPRMAARQTDLDPSNHDITLNRYAHCINLGLAVCDTPYITYLCDDDLYMPQRLEQMAGYLDLHPEVHAVYGMQALKTLDAAGAEMEDNGVRSGPAICKDAAMVVDTSSVMHRRECYEKVGGWPEDPAGWRVGDAFYWRKLNEHWPFYRIDHVTDIHRFNPRSVSYKIDHKLPLRDTKYASLFENRSGW